MLPEDGIMIVGPVDAILIELVRAEIIPQIHTDEFRHLRSYLVAYKLAE